MRGARDPRLAPLGGVQLRVVPQERPLGWLTTALRRADRRLAGIVGGAGVLREAHQPYLDEGKKKDAGRPRGKPPGVRNEVYTAWCSGCLVKRSDEFQRFSRPGGSGCFPWSACA